MLRKLILSTTIAAIAALSLTFAEYGGKGKEPKDDIPTVAQKAGQFKTLVKALQAAELVDALKGKGPFTVFAPTDEAFGKLPKETLEDLLKPENKEKLKSILLYHVVSGKYLAADVKKLKSGTQVETLLKGKKITVTQKKEGIFVNDAKVIKTDVLAKNGVIHVIDKVILPPEN
ncbi:MAG: fasciclin domain-containing protein [Armatimonadetes bacterium]|nr:fasciclin domain-containing protein [Armatimonadota bacterium]MDW8028347.1 fasciclin domain-containing protein [Armatimonadota bacterium]